MKYQAEQKTHAQRWGSIFERPVKEETGDEIVLGLIGRLNLKAKED